MGITPESALISPHQVAVCSFAIKHGGWFTTRALVTRMKISDRTARLHLKRLTDLGVLERRKLFGGCRYRVRPEADMDERAKAYLLRLTSIRETLDRRRRSIGSTLASVVTMFAI
jgi:DNA-binding transcriptional ArsR family regulator